MKPRQKPRDVEERRMQKSKSVDRGLNRSKEEDRFIYQSNRFTNNKVNEFKYSEEYRSPQQNRKPREELLKQLNQELKAENNKEKKKGGTAPR